ncbi:hypothetical protein B0T26DRAFT_434374 [Lasiosphaeria miniovina]|uniref:Uncharacterized protein n=1 Tax=Lasiosphaeria miniovina TaxID=1954250 RepID=A0AA40A6H2_9PEZI|nr:uncharacterized protein B0T26DRAFT_434374 [Lasiosphaeria miniovina]KAK0710214.1 hypothetical protein B0T26DRAFT_434374 [Lasiosphaeria miniovina]
MLGAKIPQRDQAFLSLCLHPHSTVLSTVLPAGLGRAALVLPAGSSQYLLFSSAVLLLTIFRVGCQWVRIGGPRLTRIETKQPARECLSLRVRFVHFRK